MEYPGLTAAEAERSKEQHGSNELTRQKKSGFFRQFLQSFGDPIIKILLAALAINVIFLFRHFVWYESAGIALAIFLATFVSTLSEYGSESAFAKLQEDAGKITCRVRRDGLLTNLPVGQVAVGDIVLLQAGERVPADGKLVAGQLSVDQSALNGESKEAAKRPGNINTTSELLSPGHIFRGSVVCSGEGAMEVTRVGDATFYGGVARELQEDTRESPLKVRLTVLAKTLSRIGYAAAGLVLFADMFHSLVIANNFDWAAVLAQFRDPAAVFGQFIHAVTLAITVVVVAVPEGLPMMITVVLSSNMRRMLRDHVLVRKLVGIETSGSLNILFTDKTGTLTKGKLSVTSVIGGDGHALADFKRQPIYELFTLSCLANSDSTLSGGKVFGGNATDRALMDFVLPVKNPPLYTVINHIPFDSANKYAAARVQYNGSHLSLIKGAPEKLLSACTRYYDISGKVKPLIAMSALWQRWQELTTQAMRVLVLAAGDGEWDESGKFQNLILLGLIGIRDDVRPDAKAALRQVGQAGVQTVMITGDNRETAAAIAREVGLLTGRREEAVITSAELAELSDGQVKQLMPKLRVVARALPVDKSRLVRLSQEMGLVAGMTGDGINDAPALKKADVGFAMGSGTEVAKEAGDIVILDDNIRSIAKAILYGRTIFKSIRKFIIFQLTMNLCAVAVSVIGPFIGIDTPVTVLQMLWINIIMDTLAGLAFAGEPPLSEYMEEPPKRRDEPVLNKTMLNQIVGTGLFTVGLCLVFLKSEWFKPLFRFSSNPIYWMTAFFALFIFSGVFNSFNARTHRVNLLAHLYKNKAFIAIMAAVAAVQLLLIYYGGSLFRTAGLTPRELLRILLVAAMVIPADGARKLIMRLMGRKGHI